MKNVTLLGSKILLEPIEKETITKGGIYIPDQAQDRPQLAKVIATGPGTSDYDMTAVIGDTVLHGKYAGTEIELRDKKYLIMDESDILIILGDE